MATHSVIADAHVKRHEAADQPGERLQKLTVKVMKSNAWKVQSSKAPALPAVVPLWADAFRHGEQED